MNTTNNLFLVLPFEYLLLWFITLVSLAHLQLFYIFYTNKYEWNELGTCTPFSRLFWFVYILDNIIIEWVVVDHYAGIVFHSNNHENPTATHALDLVTLIFISLYIAVPFFFGMQLFFYCHFHMKMSTFERNMWISLFGLYALVFSFGNPIPFIFTHIDYILLFLQLFIIGGFTSLSLCIIWNYNERDEFD